MESVPSNSLPATEPAAGDSVAEQDQPPERTFSPPNGWFRATAALAGLFVVTLLVQMAVLYGDGNAPPARLMDAYGTPILGLEFVALLATGVKALLSDMTAGQQERNLL